MVFVAFLAPLGAYLVALGLVNRRNRPLVASGVWDAAGMLFGLSGFLLAGGPAILTALHDRWRMWWLLGDPGAPRDTIESFLPWWLAASLAYFALVVAWAAWLLWRAGASTSVYATCRDDVALALDEACGELRLAPARSGDLYVFGSPAEGVATLDLEPFAALGHVALRWEPPDSPLRVPLERALADKLAETGSPRNEAGLLMCYAGLACMACAVAVVLLHLRYPGI